MGKFTHFCGTFNLYYSFFRGGVKCQYDGQEPHLGINFYQFIHENGLHNDSEYNTEVNGTPW